MYFPTDGFISLVTLLDGSPGVEVGMVGREGMLGAQMALGVPTAPWRALVQGQSAAWRIGAVAFRRELALSPALQRGLQRQGLIRYHRRELKVLDRKGLETAACNWFDAVRDRLIRAVGERLGQPPDGPPHSAELSASLVQAVVLDCVGALDQLHARLKQERSRRLTP